jgi:hypothetical protein
MKFPITPIVFTLGGTANGSSITWATVAPTGISYDPDTRTISGTPTVAGTYGYTITTSGHSSPCSAATITGTIQVDDCPCPDPPSLILNKSTTSYCGLELITIEDNSFGGSATQVTVTVSANAGGTVSPSTTSTSPFAITYQPVLSDIGKTIKIKVTTDNPLEFPCEAAVDSIEFTVYAAITAGITNVTGTATLGRTVSVINLTATGGTNYVWKYDGATVGTTAGIAVDTGGRYIVTVTGAGGCSDQTYIDIKVTLIGTVFPFVHWEESGFDILFPVTVSLKEPPLILGTLDATLAALQAATPIVSTTALYHDGSIFIPRSPLSPGVIGSVLNPGIAIDWGTLLIENRINNVADLAPGEGPNIINGITSGIYTLGSDPGEFILEIKRIGYVTRWAHIFVTTQGVQYLGHREIIAGDINQNRIIETTDADELKARIGGYFGDGENYDPKYDLNSDGKIDLLDYSIIIKFLNFQITNYKDTRFWLEE